MKIAVIGGGASGIMAAIAAAEEGADVIILERLDRIGKKILATGNGRCNLTNMNASEENYYGENTKFVNSVLNRFSVENTIDFFENTGLMTKVEDEGKVYPYTDQASSVLDVLRLRLQSLNVEIKCGFEAENIKKTKKGFEIISYSQEKIYADKVIVSCGGRAAPSLGSNGSGYDLVKKLGHTVTDVYPSLVQIETETDIVKSLKGIKKDCNVRVVKGDKIIAEKYGEVLFAEYGLSGPPIFTLSAKIPKEKNIIFSLDCMSEYSYEELVNMLMIRRSVMGGYRLEDFFVGFLNKKIIYAILKSIGIAPLSRLGESLSDKEIDKIAYTIKNWNFKFIKTRSWNNAQATKGGVPVREIDKNMQSKKAEGLYITGELLDIDGDCGGYNLQWAWSTGYIAGKAVCG